MVPGRKKQKRATIENTFLWDSPFGRIEGGVDFIYPTSIIKIYERGLCNNE